MKPVVGTVSPQICFSGKRDGIDYELCLTPDDEIVLILRQVGASPTDLTCHCYGLPVAPTAYRGCWSVFEDAVVPILSDWRWNNEMSYDFVSAFDDLEQTTSLVDAAFTPSTDDIALDALIYVVSHSSTCATATLTLAETPTLQVGTVLVNLTEPIMSANCLNLNPTMVVDLEPVTGSLLHLKPFQIEIDASNPMQVLRSHARIVADLSARQIVALESIAALIHF